MSNKPEPENNMVMVHLEFEFGKEEKPQFCLKFPVTLEAALIALLVSFIEKCEHT